MTERNKLFSNSILRIAVLLASLALPACRRSGGPGGSCRLPVSELPQTSTPVKKVHVMWDVSGSMKGFVAPTKAKALLPALWRDLDRRWIREAGSQVTDVRHYALGNAVEKLKGPPAAGDLAAPWTNLPAGALKAAQLLADDDTTAVVVVSDMQLEMPPETGGKAVCGKVTGPSGGGVAPRLFSQCLLEGWEGKVPSSIQVRFLRFTSTAKGAVGPLFVGVLSRDESFARSLGQTLSTAPELHKDAAAELTLVTHAKALPCGTMGKCGFHVQPELILRSASQATCDFVVLSAIESHRLRCGIELAPLKDLPLISRVVERAEFDRGEPYSEGGVVELGTTKEGKRDVRLQFLPRGGAPDLARASKPFHLIAAWHVAEDAEARIAAWLGPGSGAFPYREIFLPLAQDMVAGLPDSACSETWKVKYSK